MRAHACDPHARAWNGYQGGQSGMFKMAETGGMRKVSAALICQKIADGPGYMVPCPVCSWLDRQDSGPDLIIRPMVYRARGARPVVQPCCTLSSHVGREATDEAAIALEWLEVVMKAFADAKTGKIATTMPRLARKGFLPSAFAIALPE